MHITYHRSLLPLVECMAFLEKYANDNDYIALKDYMKNDHDMHHVYKQLDDIKNDMGKIMDRFDPNIKFWFTFLPKHTNSPIKVILLECFDDTLATWEAQYNDIVQKVNAHPNLLLRCALTICKEELEEPLKQMNETELMEQLNDCELNDDIKWKLFQMNLHIHDVMEKLGQLLHLVMPVYEKHEPLLQTLLQVYLEDLDRYGDTLYDQFAQNTGIHFANKTETCFLIPTLGYSNSFMIGDNAFLTPKHTYILWGVYLLQTNLLKNDSIESICISLKTLSDKSKFEILCFLSKNKQAYGAQIAKAMNLTTATISYHMQALIDAQLVHVEKCNNRLYFKVNEEHLRMFMKQVEQKILHPQ